jgi:hypothetical protein
MQPGILAADESIDQVLQLSVSEFHFGLRPACHQACHAKVGGSDVNPAQIQN